MKNENQSLGAAIARIIDHTLLKANATKEQIICLCNEAITYQFATVCINPYWIPLALEQLQNTSIGITTVVGFPLGCSSTLVKITEAKESISNGATEIDMVLNIGALKSGDYDAVRMDIEGVVQGIDGAALLKVILETGYLTDEEKRLACRICKAAGADFVKTSTGFGEGGATVEDVKLMRKMIGSNMGIKASGGVRDLEFASILVAAGATRIGASASVEIATGGHLS